MARFSIRGLLLAVAFVAVVCAALKYAGPVWWTILSTVALLLLMGLAVIALVGKGERRAGAVGYVACFSIYGGLLLLSSTETVQSTAPLPTSHLLELAVESVLKPEVIYVDPTTGKPLAEYEQMESVRYVRLSPDYTPKDLPQVIMSGSKGPVVGYFRRVDREDIIRIGHLLWAILFGFLGSACAGFVYRRHHSEAKPVAT